MSSRFSLTLWRVYLSLGLTASLLTITIAIGSIITMPKMEANTSGNIHADAFRYLGYATLSFSSLFVIFTIWMLSRRQHYTITRGAQDMDDLHPGFLQKISETYSTKSYLETQMAENIANQRMMLEDFE